MTFNPLNQEGVLSSAQERADLYKLLSQCYYLPDSQLFESIKNFKFSDNPAYRGLVATISAEDELEDLLVDFTQLFSGPFKALAIPYGSIYLDGNRRVMGDSTIDVGKFYQEEGLKVNIKEIPDHIGIELEFMYFLIIKEMQAAQSNDGRAFEHFRDRQCLFLTQYLAPWVFEFVDNIEVGAKSKFYKAVAKTTKNFIERDLKNL